MKSDDSRILRIILGARTILNMRLGRRVIDASLNQKLKDVLRGIVDADLPHASTAEIMHVVTPIVEGAERAQERAALTMLEDAPGAERVVVCGLEPTLAMLQQRRVELLLIAEGARFTTGICPLCGRVSTSRRRCEWTAWA
jgi:peptide subunit release factor 1 (eRF1)